MSKGFNLQKQIEKLEREIIERTPAILCNRQTTEIQECKRYRYYSNQMDKKPCSAAEKILKDLFAYCFEAANILN